MELSVNFEVNDGGHYWWYGESFSKEENEEFKRLRDSGKTPEEAFIKILRAIAPTVSELRDEDINSDTVRIFSIEFNEE